MPQLSTIFLFGSGSSTLIKAAGDHQGVNHKLTPSLVIDVRLNTYLHGWFDLETSEKLHGWKDESALLIVSEPAYLRRIIRKELMMNAIPKPDALVEPVKDVEIAIEPIPVSSIVTKSKRLWTWLDRMTEANYQAWVKAGRPEIY